MADTVAEKLLDSRKHARLKVREAFIFESFATRRLKECLQQPANHERRRWVQKARLS